MKKDFFSQGELSELERLEVLGGIAPDGKGDNPNSNYGLCGIHCHSGNGCDGSGLSCV